LAQARTSETHPIRVDFLPDEVVNLSGRIGLTIAPGKKDPHASTGPCHRDLVADLRRLRAIYSTETLVTLLEQGQFAVDEFALLGIENLAEATEAARMEHLWLPIRDGAAPPSLDAMFALVKRILEAVREGENVVIHCRGGLGRSGMVAACCVVALGASVSEALEVVRSVRPGAIETRTQELCVHAFDERWRTHLVRKAEPDAVTDLFADTSQLQRARISGPGVAPLSHPGAATLVYLGLADEAQSAGVMGAAPLREGDDFHVMPGEVLFIGRGKECDVVLATNQLSRVHAMVAFVRAFDDVLLLADLDSRNGTWVDDAPVTSRFVRTDEVFELARAYRFAFESIG
jgi:hypothetical protein